MNNFITPIWINLIVISLYLVGPIFAKTGIMFIDEIYEAKRTNDIQYGKGSTGNPASGSIDLFLDLHQPNRINLTQKKPALIVIHGGAFTLGTKEAPTISKLCESFAKRGYVCASIQYRLAGDDPTFEPGPFINFNDRLRAINAAAQDAAKAARWLRQNAKTYNIDPSRIGIVGSSAGAITSLFTACQDADILGPDAEIGVVIDLWGAMYGHENLIDADTAAIFIAHGTNDRIVPYSQTEALTDHLDDIKHPYALYPLSGARHGPWERFYSDIVDDKTIFQHSVEFAFKHLKLIEIHPASELLNRQLDITIDQSKNQLTLTYPSVIGFRYFVQSSEDLTGWNTKNTDSPILGSGNFISYTSQISPSPQSLSKKFYRILVTPNF